MGISCHTHVTMNRPTIHSPEVVHDILLQFDLLLELQVVNGNDGKSELAFVTSEHMGVDWPSAVQVEDLPDTTNDDEWFDAAAKVHDEQGQQGLVQLLLALSPYLNETLTLQAAIFWADGYFDKAKEWTIRPGATEVEVKEIVAMDDEHSIVSSS